MELVRGFIGRLSDTIESIQCLIPLRESSEHYNSDEVSIDACTDHGGECIAVVIFINFRNWFFFNVKYFAFPLIEIYSSL